MYASQILAHVFMKSPANFESAASISNPLAHLIALFLINDFLYYLYSSIKP